VEEDQGIKRTGGTIRDLCRHFFGPVNSPGDHAGSGVTGRFVHALKAEFAHLNFAVAAQDNACLLQFEVEMYTFVEFPEVPSEYNAEARSVRQIVNMRSISGGVRSKQNSKTMVMQGWW
jgi:hypothetical protein